MVKRSLCIVIAVMVGTFKLSAMEAPVFSEERLEEARKLQEQTPQLFKDIENLGTILRHAHSDGQPEVGKTEIAALSKDQLSLFKNAATKYLSWAEWHMHPAKEQLEPEYQAALAKVPQDSKLANLIKMKNTKEVQQYDRELKKKEAKDAFKTQLKSEKLDLISMRAPGGKTLFHLLARVDSTGEIFNYLYEKAGKKQTLDSLLEIKDEKGNNIVHILSLFDNKELFRILRKKFPAKIEALENEKNSEGKTPRDLAAEFGHPEMAAILTQLPESPRK